MKRLFSIALLTLTFAFPAFAQEATAAPESTEAAPVVVVVEAPAEAPAENNDLAILLPAIFGIVGMLWGIVASVLNHKSLPVSEVDKLLARVYEMSLQSKATEDEKLVKAAMTVWQGMKDLGLVPVVTEVSAPATTTTTTTTTTPIELEAKG